MTDNNGPPVVSLLDQVGLGQGLSLLDTPPLRPLAAAVLTNPVGTESVQQMTAADPSFQPGVAWGGGLVSRPFSDAVQNATNLALGMTGQAPKFAPSTLGPQAFRKVMDAFEARQAAAEAAGSPNRPAGLRDMLNEFDRQAGGGTTPPPTGVDFPENFWESPEYLAYRAQRDKEMNHLLPIELSQYSLDAFNHELTQPDVTAGRAEKLQRMIARIGPKLEQQKAAAAAAGIDPGNARRTFVPPGGQP